MRASVAELSLFGLLACAQAVPVDDRVAEGHASLEKRVKILVNIGLLGGRDTSPYGGWLNGENPCHLVDSGGDSSDQYFAGHLNPTITNPCGRKFTIHTGSGSSSYTWEGCGSSQTWLNHAGGGFAGNCQWAPKTITCTNVFGIKIQGKYQCTVDA